MVSRLWAKTGIHARLCILFFVAAAPLLVLSLTDAILQRQQAFQVAQVHLRDLAMLTAERTDVAVQDAENLLQMLARMPVLQGSLDECPATLRAVVDDHPRIAAILVARPDGRVLCASRQQFADRSVADRQWFADAFAAAPIASNRAPGRMFGPVVDETADGAAVVATPLPSSAGVLAIRLNLGWQGEPAQPEMENFVIDLRSGAILVHKPDAAPTSWLPGSPYGRTLVAALRADLRQAQNGRAQGLVEVPEPDGVVHLFGYAQLADGAVSAVGVSRAVVMQTANRRLLVGLLLAVALGGGAVGLAWYFARCWVVIPLRRLNVATARFGRGELHMSWMVSATDPPELRGVRATLDGMADRLRISDAEVAAARAGLACIQSLRTRNDDARDGSPLAIRSYPREERLELPAWYGLSPTHEDPLTGLLNRRGFDMALGLEYRTASHFGTPLALIMIEIDHFGADHTPGHPNDHPNDHSMGHPNGHTSWGRSPGDAVLRGFARVIDGQLRHTHDRAALYGEGIFAAILPATDEGHAMIVAEAVRHSAAAAFLINASLANASLANASLANASLANIGSPATPRFSGVATVRMGVAAFVPGNGDGGPAKLVELADAALRDAKRHGRIVARAASQLTR